MKCVKTLSLAAIAATALMAFIGASTASATVLTSPKGTALGVGTTIHAVGEGTLTLTTSFKNIECKEGAEGTPTVSGKITTAGGAGKEVIGTVETLTWGTCNCEVKTLKKGTLWVSVSTAPNGTLTSNGAEVTSQCNETIFGNVHCIYKTEFTVLGTLTGSEGLKNSTARMDIEKSEVPHLGTNFLCGAEGFWDAHYEVTKPDYLDVS